MAVENISITSADNRTLAGVYAEAQSGWASVEKGDVRWPSAEFDKTRDLFSECASLVRKECTFSENEELDDVKTGDLQYLLIDFYLGKLLMRVMDMDQRAACIRRGVNYLLLFLDRLDKLGILNELDQESRQALLKGADASGQTDVNRRERKLKRWKQDKLLREQMSALSTAVAAANKEGYGTDVWHAGAADGMDEENSREWIRLMILMSAGQAIGDIEMSERELQMLAHRKTLEKEKNNTEHNHGRGARAQDNRCDHRHTSQCKLHGCNSSHHSTSHSMGHEVTNPNPTSDINRRGFGSGLTVTKINQSTLDGTLQVKRSIIKAGVFRPDHNQPTMGLEEFAELEFADAIRRQELAAKSAETGGGPVLKYSELCAEGKEDDIELADKATMKDRAWDDWKDEHQKGSGKKKLY